MSPDTPQPAAPAPHAAKASAGRRGVQRWGLRVLALVVAIISGLVVTFFSIDLGPRVKALAERQGSKGLLRPLHIGNIRALVGRGEFEVTDVVIEGLKPSDTPFLVVKRAYVKVPWWTVFRGELVVESVRLTGWKAQIETWPGDIHNVPRFTSNNPTSKPLPFKIMTREIIAENGEFEYQDHGLPWSAVCRNLSVTVVRTLGTYYGRMAFTNGTVKVQSYLPMQASMDAGFKIENQHMLLHRIKL